MIRRTLSTALFIGVACAGCASSQGGPRVVSAADQPTYAMAYPSRTEGLIRELDAQETEAKGIIASWDKLPADLGATTGLDVRGLFERAERGGKSAGYVAERRDMNRVKTFFAEEKDELGRRVAGAVEYAAAQKECGDKDLGSAAAYGMREAVTKRIERRLRAHNDAETTLDEEGFRLDKATAAKLEKVIDDIATASFIVNVGVEDVRKELRASYADAGDVRATLDAAIKDNDAKLADPARPEAAKKVLRTRQSELAKDRAAIDDVVARTKQTLAGVDERLSGLKKEYEAKWKALVERLPPGP